MSSRARIRILITVKGPSNVPSGFAEMFEVADKAFSFSFICGRIFIKYFSHSSRRCKWSKKVHQLWGCAYSSETGDFEDREHFNETFRLRSQNCYQTQRPNNTKRMLVSEIVTLIISVTVKTLAKIFYQTNTHWRFKP